MKGPQLSALIWLANLLVLAGGAFAGYKVYTEAEAEREDILTRVETPKTKEQRKTWTQTLDAGTTEGHKYYQDTLLTPRKRPDPVSISPNGGTLARETTLTANGGVGTPNFTWSIEGTVPKGVSLSTTKGRSVTLKFGESTPLESAVTVRVSDSNTGETVDTSYTLSFSKPVVPVITDEQLKAELEKWVNSQFTLLRLWTGSDEFAKAIVISKEAGNATLIFKAGMHFRDYAKSIDDKVKKLAAHDLEVVKINWDHVLIKGPSRNAQYKDRYFEVKLSPDPKAFEKPDLNSLGKAGTIRENKLPRPDTPPPDPNVEVVDTRPEKSTYDPATDTWTLGREDYQNVDVDDMARYAKVVHDREGKPLGIQITDDIPEDHSVVARGGRKGDIIKAINGKPVASMSDVRRIVRTDYNAGVTDFVVTFERDGVPGTKIFKVPQKKNNDADSDK